MKISFKIIAAVVLLVLLLLTKPSSETHNERIIEDFKSKNELLGAIIPAKKKIVENVTDFHDCVLFSAKTADGELVSVGALGFVYVKGLETDL